MKRIGLFIVLMVVLAITTCSLGYVSVPLSVMEDAVFVYPPATDTGFTLQNAYDYITSSDRDAKMGTLSVLNQRTLLLTSGNYTSTSLVLDTDYVNIMGLGDVTITDTSGAVIDCGDVTCSITNIRLDADADANGLTNDSNVRCSNVTIIDGTDEIIYVTGLAGSVVYDITDGFLDNITHCEFESAGIVSTKTSGGGAATGATGAENLWLYPQGMFEYHILGTQTILQPVIAAGGVNIGLDQTDDDGVEITQGITSQSSRAYVVGTDACYLKVKFSIATVAGTDDCAVGFRKAEAYQAAIDSYDEWACFNIQAGVVNLETELNAGGTTTTDTNEPDWADGETHTLEVYVALDGAVTYKIDGGEPSYVAEFSFDSAEVIVPFFYLIQANAAQTGVVLLQSWECGSKK